MKKSAKKAQKHFERMSFELESKDPAIPCDATGREDNPPLSLPCAHV